LKSFQSVVQEARSGKRLRISSIRVLVLRVDWREKAGSIKLSGRVEGAAFEALVPAQTDQYPQVEALKLRAFRLKFSVPEQTSAKPPDREIAGGKAEGFIFRFETEHLLSRPEHNIAWQQ
jgi:hypothetical protein